VKVLVVAWYFPPLQGTGIFRTVAVVNWLARHGHQVTVIAPDRAYFERVAPLDEAMLAAVPEAVRVVEVPFPDLEDPIVNRWPIARAMDRDAWKDATRAWALSQFPEPYYGVWRERISAAALRLHDEIGFERVYATASAYVDYAVAETLFSYAGVPYVLDDRDSFLFSVYDGQDRPHADAARRWWEVLAAAASALWFVNPPIAELYRRRYPGLADRIHVVENGWEPSLLDVTRLAERPENPVFSYLGAINTGFLMEELLTAWQETVPRLPGAPELRLYGNFGTRNRAAVIPDDAEQALAAVSGKFRPALREMVQQTQGLRVMGAIPKAAVPDAYRETSVLVFFKEGGPLITSSKIYEYLATGLPIVAVVTPDHDSRRLLAQYPRAHVGDITRPETWAQVFLAAWEDAQTDDPQVRRRAVDVGARFTRERLLDEPLASFVRAADKE